MLFRSYYGEDWKAPAGFMTKEEAEKAANADDVQPEANVAEPRKKDGRTE